jgi:hypothetical protein
MLPFCDRSVSVARKDVAPVWTRSFPIAKKPTTLGQHLKKKRFMAGMRQDEAAVKLGVKGMERNRRLCQETGEPPPQVSATCPALSSERISLN